MKASMDGFLRQNFGGAAAGCRALSYMVFMLCWLPMANGQLSGVKTIPGTYPSFLAAVLDLNAQGVGPGGVTFDIAAGYTEANVAVVLNLSVNPTDETRPVIFQKSGVGPNPVFTAPVGTSTNFDAIVTLFGADYVTFNGIDLQENPANTTPTQQMEWGYALLKPNDRNGCQHNTIQNCTVTLDKSNPKSAGIYVGNHTNISLSALGVFQYIGSSSYNHFYNNTIQNCFRGIVLEGSNSYFGLDIGNEIGVDGQSTRRNQILNFGGGSTGTANGISCNHQAEVRIFSTYVDNAGGAATSTTLNGISLLGANYGNIRVYDDTVTVSANGATTALTGIYNDAGLGATVSIYNCLVTGCTNTAATTATFRGIAQLAEATRTEIYGNRITNNTLAGTGTMSPIYYVGQGQTVVLDVEIHDNVVDGNTKTGNAGSLILIDANVPTYKRSIHHNILTNNSNTGSSGATYAYFNAAANNLNERIYSNQVYGLNGGSGETVAIKATSGKAIELKIYNNDIHDIAGNTTTTVGGILADNANQGFIYGNKIYDIVNHSTIGVAASVYGIWIGNTFGLEWNLYNNTISRLQAPNMSSPAPVHAFALFGYSNSILGHSFIHLYHNTVYLNASSTGTDFGTRMVYMENVQDQEYELRNNLLVDLSTPAGSGQVIAFHRLNTAPLSRYALSSGHNCIYAGVPDPYHLIYFDGPNSHQTIQAFKDQMVPREQSSFSELPPFVNVATAPYDLHVQPGIATQTESGGKPIPMVAADRDGDLRNTATPDVGADEFTGIMADIAAPDIRYVPLTNGSVGVSRAVPLFAFVTDPSSINVAPGTKPRLYYKKSTHVNAYTGNTSATDGWKYVEATNGSSPFSFVMDYSLMFGGAVAAGDAIQYFVVAQDLNAVPRVGISNGAFALAPASVALSAVNFPIGNPQHQYLVVANAYSGSILVGPTESITSLTNAGGVFSLLNAGVLTGNVSIEVTGDLVAETGTFALNQWAEQGGTGYTVSIVPSGAVTRLIAGSNTLPGLIRLDGADRVHIDGRINGAGRYLRLRNTSNSAPTVTFINDASHNVLRNCIVESGNTLYSSSNAGAIMIGATNKEHGSDSLLITDNEIRDRSDISATPRVAILCKNLMTSAQQMNNGTVISNNDIHDWHQPSVVGQIAIYIDFGCSDFTITGNNFYQTATRSHSGSGVNIGAIQIYNPEPNANSGGHIIDGNFIGGTAPGATGGSMTYTAVGSLSFTGINVQTGLRPCSISNNTIRQINSTCNTGFSLNPFVGIYAGQGNFEIGTAGGNTIGSGTANGSVTLTLNGNNFGNNPDIVGVSAQLVNGTANVRNNVIGGWTIGGNLTANNNGYLSIFPIIINGSPNRDFSVSRNSIGGSVPNSIHNTLAVRSRCNGIFVYHQSNGPKVSVDSNSVRNLTNMAIEAAILGNTAIYNSAGSSVAQCTYTHNLVENFKANANGGSVGGIYVFGNHAFGTVVTDNTVSGVENLSTAASSSRVIGIQVNGSTNGHIVARNRVSGLSNAETGTTPELVGLQISYGNRWQVTNNMVSIDNGTHTNSVLVSGISEYVAGASDICYNTVYIGGTNFGIHNSYAFARNLAYELNLRNNLFYNERSGGSGLHCAMGLPFSTFPNYWAPSWSSYNTYIAPKSNGAMGEGGTTTGQSFSQWKAMIGGDVESYADTTANVPADSLFTNKATGDLSIVSTQKYCWYVNGKGIAGTASLNLPQDMNGDARSILLGTPTDIGADEFAPAPGVLPIAATASAAPALGATTSYSFAGRKLGEIAWGPSGVVPAAVVWDYYSSVPPPGAIGSNVNSYWDVQAAGGSGYSYDLRSYYTLHEQNQLADGLLNLGRQTGGSPWYYLAGTPAADVDGKYYLRNGLTSFTRYTLGGSAPAADFVITATVGSGSGTISPAGSVNVTPLNDQTFSIGASGCQFIDSVVVDGINIGAVSSYTFAHVAANHTIQVYFNTMSLTVGATITVSPSGTVCPGSNLTFTATVANGGTAPNYQWQVSGGNVGSNSSTYNTATLANGDQVQCIVTSNDPCVSAPTVSSNVVTVTVQDLVPPTANCQAVTVNLNINGSGSLATSDVNNGSVDNCGIASYGLNQTVFGCADVGLQSVTLTVTDNSGNSSTCVSAVTVNAPALNPTIVQNGNTLTSVQVWSSYQWLLNGVPISGANGNSYIATQSGAYSLMVTDANGCSDTTAVINVVVTGLGGGGASWSVALYPNPARDFFRVSLEQPIDVSLDVKITDMFGRLMVEQVLPAMELSMDFDVHAFAAGTYIVEVSGRAGVMERMRLVVQ